MTLNIINEARLALRTALLTWSGCPLDAAGKPAVQWENKSRNSTTNELYLREAMLPADSSRMSIGPVARVRTTAIWQLSVFIPANTGVGNEGVPDGLVNLFWPGLQLTTSGGLIVTVRKSKRGVAMQEPGWWHVPVSVQFIIDSLTP